MMEFFRSAKVIIKLRERIHKLDETIMDLYSRIGYYQDKVDILEKQLAQAQVTNVNLHKVNVHLVKKRHV